MPIDKNTQLPITQISGLDINYTNSNSTLTVPRVTNVERDNLVNIVTETEPQGTVKTSTIIFNVDEDAFQGKSKAGWVNFAGNAPAANTVLYDNTGIAAAANTIAIFNNDKGTTIQGSGVAIARVPAAKNENAEVTQLSNIGVLQFGNSTSTLDHASILLNGSSAINLQENQSNTATIISSGLPQGSSSPSATLEINTNEGALLVSRLTTTERDALVSPQDGYICYNTTTKKLNFRQNGKWLEYSDSNNGYLPAKSISADYQATNDDCVIYVQDSELHVPVDIYLPNTTPGKLWIIKDGRDNASQYPITIYPELSTYPYTINTDGGYLWLIGHEGDVGYDIINISSTNTGNVVGPSTSTKHSLAVYSDTTGKKLENTNNIIYERNNISFPSGSNFIGIYNNLTGINIADSGYINLCANTLDVYNHGSNMQGGEITISASQNYSIRLTTQKAHIFQSPEIEISSNMIGGSGPFKTTIRKNNTTQIDDTYFVLPNNNPKPNQQLVCSDTNNNTYWSYGNVTYVTNNYTVLDTDYIIEVGSSPGCTITLPKRTVDNIGRRIIIKDWGIATSQFPIKIVCTSTDTIDVQSSYSITSNHGYIEVYGSTHGSSKWLIIGKG